MLSLNLIVQNYFQATRTKDVTEFFVILTKLFDLSPAFILISVCVTAIIYLRNGIRYSIFFLSGIFSTIVVVSMLKLFFNTARPLDGVINVSGGSFPSFHATIVTVFFITLNYIFYNHRFSKILFIPLSVVLVPLVALSRIYLGVHWLSDVVFGVFLGVVISISIITIFKKRSWL